MAASQAALEWTVLEDYRELAPTQLEAAGPTSQPPAREVERSQAERAGRLVLAQEQWLAASLALVGLIVMSGWLWQTHPQPVVPQPQGKVTTVHEEQAPEAAEPAETSPEEGQTAANTIAVEWQALEPAHPGWFPPVVAQAANQLRQVQYAAEFADLHSAIQATDGPEQTTRSTHVLAFQHDLALVEVISQDTDGGQRYRQQRAYRRTEQGWQEADATGTVLGPWQTLETAYFTLRYRSSDAGAVAEAVPTLDGLYEKMRFDLALPAPDVSAKIALEVAGNQLPPYAYVLEQIPSPLTVPSPSLLQVPVEVSKAEVLKQALVYTLAGLAARQALVQQPGYWQRDGARWLLLLDGLRLWEVWANEGPLAGEQTEVVRWLYRNAQSDSYSAIQRLPSGYDHLCHLSRMWQLWPVHLSIPLTCTESDRTWLGPIQLADRLLGLYNDPLNEPEYETSGIAMAVSLATVLEYIVTTYGREQLPLLVQALDEHTSWNTLVPAVFGVSIQEFEAGWQTYLAEHYGSAAH